MPLSSRGVKVKAGCAIRAAAACMGVLTPPIHTQHAAPAAAAPMVGRGARGKKRIERETRSVSPAAPCSLLRALQGLLVGQQEVMQQLEARIDERSGSTRQVKHAGDNRTHHDQQQAAGLAERVSGWQWGVHHGMRGDKRVKKRVAATHAALLALLSAAPRARWGPAAQGKAAADQAAAWMDGGW